MKVNPAEKETGELIVIKTKVNHQARASLAKTLLEDEMSRINSQEKAVQYLLRRERIEDKTNTWLIHGLCFIIGVLLTILVDALIWQLPVFK